jgi:hypothetical protein
MRAKWEDVVAFLSWPVDRRGEVGGAKRREHLGARRRDQTGDDLSASPRQAG